MNRKKKPTEIKVVKSRDNCSFICIAGVENFMLLRLLYKTVNSLLCEEREREECKLVEKEARSNHPENINLVKVCKSSGISKYQTKWKNVERSIMSKKNSAC